MVTIESKMHVLGMRASSVINFMLTATDSEYQEWWPGTHFEMHAINDLQGVGQKIVMTELVGDKYLKMHWIVADLGPNRITWQLLAGVRLPCRLTLKIDDDAVGATITHTIRAGANGLLGLVVDPLVRLSLSSKFANAMDKHFTFEFSQLPKLLERIRPCVQAESPATGAKNAA